MPRPPVDRGSKPTPSSSMLSATRPGAISSVTTTRRARACLVTFVIASGIAGIAGVLDGIKNSSISPFMGLSVAVKGLVVMLLGGLGNVVGAMVGGLMLGMIEILTAAYIGTSVRDFFTFAILILILIYRPTGLFGTRVLEER